MRPRPQRQVPRLGLNRAEAAEALGMSPDHFDRHVRPHLRCTYSGQLTLYAVSELQRWLDENAVAGGQASAA